MRNFRLNRRALLRSAGFAGISIALPPLEAMVNKKGLFYSPTNAQGVAAAKKLILFHWPQGIARTNGFFYPKELGNNWTMTPGLEPLVAYKNQFNVISDLHYGALEVHTDSHGHAKSLFTGYAQGTAGHNEGQARGISVDTIAGRSMGALTKLPSIVTGLYEYGEGWWSWEENVQNGQVVGYVQKPPVIFPHLLFDSLFKGVNLDPAVQNMLNEKQRSVLDFVSTDIQSLQKDLGSSDKQRLDQHLSTIRDMEVALNTTFSSECVLPTRPRVVPSVDLGGFGEYVNWDNIDYNSNAQVVGIRDYAKLMIDLVVMGLQCDITNVALISLGGSQNYKVYPVKDPVTGQELATDYHNICHSGFNDIASRGPRLSDQPLIERFYNGITTIHMEILAHLFLRVTTNDMSGKNMLDRSALIACSEFKDGGLHEARNVPFIVAGKAGMGTPMKTGYHIGASGRCFNDVFQSAMMAVGALADGQTYGDPGIGTKPLNGLWI